VTVCHTAPVVASIIIVDWLSQLSRMAVLLHVPVMEYMCHYTIILSGFI